MANLLLVLATAAAFAGAAPKIETPKKPVEQTYHGTVVKDDYAWLENADDTTVKKWTEQQNDSAEKYLSQIPSRKKIAATLTKWSSKTSPAYGALDFHGGKYFSVKSQPPLDQPLLVTLTSPDDLKTEKVVLDLNKYDKSGGTSIDWYVASNDGKWVAVALSKKGSEIAELHVFDAETGKELSDRVPRVNAPTAGGSAAWNPDNTGVYYTRYPAPGERAKEDLFFFQQVYFHKLGTDVKDDTYVIGKEFPRIAEVELLASHDGKNVLAQVANGDGGEFSFYLMDEKGKWSQLAKDSDRVIAGEFGHDGDLFLISRQGAPHGKVLRLKTKDAKLKSAEVVVPEDDSVIEYISTLPGYLAVRDMMGGPSRLRIVDLKSGKQRVVPTEEVSSIKGVLHTSGSGLLFNSESYLHPSAWYAIDAATEAAPKITSLVMKSPVDFSDITVSREFALSKDGTKVPVNILTKKGFKKSGKAPTLLYGYGGYGVNMGPRYMANLHLWLDKGGVWAEANLRGGGEYGDDWHKNGMLTKKQNVFDDFAAAGEHLIKEKYTDNKHLAIEGGSNGGLLMGASMTQHPELFAAVVAHVGIYDMLKVETDPNGEFNITEFGTVKNPDHFKALYAYSPYHNVKGDSAYPPVMFTTGANDGRVNPYQSKKMTAKLQELKLKTPVLLRVNFGAGHGQGKKLSDRISERADVYAFLFKQLGVK